MNQLARVADEEGEDGAAEALVSIIDTTESAVKPRRRAETASHALAAITAEVVEASRYLYEVTHSALIV